MSMSLCVHCGGNRVDTIDSRHTPTSPWRMRRKRCAACGARWSTYEVPTDVLDGIVDFRKYISAMKEDINRLDTILSGVPIIKDTCNAERTELGMGEAA